MEKRTRLSLVIILALCVSGCGTAQLINAELNPFYDPIADRQQYLDVRQHPERFVTLSDKIVFEDGWFIRKRLLRHRITGKRTLEITNCSLGRKDEVYREDLICPTPGRIQRRRPLKAINILEGNPDQPYVPLGKTYYQGTYPPNISAAKKQLREQAYYHYGADAVMDFSYEVKAVSSTDIPQGVTCAISRYVEYSGTPIAFQNSDRKK